MNEFACSKGVILFFSSKDWKISREVPFLWAAATFMYSASLMLSLESESNFCLMPDKFELNAVAAISHWFIFKEVYCITICVKSSENWLS